MVYRQPGQHKKNRENNFLAKIFIPTSIIWHDHPAKEVQSLHDDDV